MRCPLVSFLALLLARGLWSVVVVGAPSWLLKYKSDAQPGVGHANDMVEEPFKHVQDAIVRVVRALHQELSG
jgi:hypothetical protein